MGKRESIGAILLMWTALLSADQRGEYLLVVAGCVACHTADAKEAEPLAGGRALSTPFGVIYSPNITPSSAGIGRWRFNDFEKALRQGIRPDGEYYYPVFPFTSYRHLTDDDVHALFDALQKQKTSEQPNRNAELSFPFNQRSLLAAWRAIHFDVGAPIERTDGTRADSDDVLATGRYLTEAVVHCSECHSPRDAIGGVMLKQRWAGAALPSGHHAPDLRPHHKALGAWSEEDIAEYLKSGRSDYTRKARDEMLEFIQCCTAQLSEDDRMAIARYLLQLPKPKPHHKRGPRSHSATIR